MYNSSYNLACNAMLVLTFPLSCSTSSAASMAHVLCMPLHFWNQELERLDEGSAHLPFISNLSPSPASLIEALHFMHPCRMHALRVSPLKDLSRLQSHVGRQVKRLTLRFPWFVSRPTAEGGLEAYCSLCHASQV